MAAGLSAGSFGGGFAQGLSRVLLSHRESSQRRKADEEARKDRLFQSILPIVLSEAENVADAEPLFAERFPELFKAKGKGGAGGAGKPSAFESIAPFLAPLSKRQKDSADESFGTAVSDAERTGEPAPIQGMPFASPAVGPGPGGAPAPPPDRRTLLGVPVLSREEKDTREIDLGTRKIEQGITAKTALAKRLYDQGAAPTLQAAQQMVGLTTEKPMEVNRGATVINPSTGEVIFAPDPALDTSGDYNAQRTVGVLPGEPRSKAREFIFDPRTRSYTEQDGTPVTQAILRVPDQPQQPIIIQTGEGPQLVNRGAGRARPITDAQGNVIGPMPTAGMREKADARILVRNSINAIKTLGDQVITRIGPAQRADAAKRGVSAVFGNDAQFRTYQDARMALAGNLAVGQQGSRPSDADIKAIWLPMVPDPFSDTRASSDMKWRLINIMSQPQLVEGEGLDVTRPARAGGAGGAGVRGGASSAPTGATADRVKARQYLLSVGKQADDATIRTFLSRPQNVQFLRGWQGTAGAAR